MNGRELDDSVLTFAPSGWTYEFTFVLWDYETGSLWLPVNCECSPAGLKNADLISLAENDERRFQCISGKYADRILPAIEMDYTWWTNWVILYPQTKFMINP